MSSSAEQRTPAGTRKRAPRVTQSQTDILVQYMVAHPLFATSKFVGKEGKVHHDDQWGKLAATLNAVQSGAQKSVKQWQVVWRDAKSNVTSKLASRRRALNATGNNEIVETPLSSNELKIASVVGTEYMEGTQAADSIPEQEGLQIRLENGDWSALAEPLQTNYVSSDEVNQISFQSQEDGSSILVLQDGLVLQNTQSTNQAPEAGDPYDYSVDFDDPVEGTSSTPITKKQKISAKRVKNPSRERLGVQLESARLNFQALFEQQNKCLQMIADASQLQAEAAMKQAEASKVQAEALRLQAENERRRLDIFSQLAAALPQNTAKSAEEILHNCSQLDLLLSST